MITTDILHIILPILVGGVIGYFTNSIAIKMLFRPHRAYYIGKLHVPFTPGIIPKNQKRLAGAIGDAVSNQLLTKDAIIESVSGAGDKYFTRIAESLTDTELSVMKILPDSAQSTEVLERVSEAVSESIVDKLKHSDIESVVSKLGGETISTLATTAPMLSMFLNDSMQEFIFEKVSEGIRNYINGEGEEAIKNTVSDYIRDMVNKPFGEMITEEEKRENLRDAIEGALRNAVAKHGASLIDLLDIRGIVTLRIEEMDMDELEDLVLSVMKQELQAVINLGAVIGAVIGTINIFL